MSSNSLKNRRTASLKALMAWASVLPQEERSNAGLETRICFVCRSRMEMMGTIISYAKFFIALEV
ncbi:MAG: hypothetical protein COR54_17250 [Elusimicrobia bacterium CG22_combo_CG10-13_8_21_14_all_63_91]|nr:MAG: hypothetical protein COR54_17250 [Elusimicrobia bacterium CG22_combo_CG10-13_8_21_14_all_63_91]